MQGVGLLERQSEQAALADLVAAAAAGSGRFGIVEGAAGVGKTRLLSEARATAAKAGMSVLAARGTQLERGSAFGVVRQLFESALIRADEQTRKSLLRGAAGQAAALLMPETRTSAVELDASLATMHGLFWLTANLCELKPVALVVDDLHWCDVSSLRWLAYLTTRLEGLPVLLLSALRTGEPCADERLLDQLVTDPTVTVLRLAPLSVDGSAQLLRALIPGEVEHAFVTACHDLTGGNPLLLRELAGVVIAEGLAPSAQGMARLAEVGSRAIVRRVGLQLGRLGAEPTALARAVAILGDGAEIQHATTLAGLAPPAAEAGLASLRRSEILTSSPAERKDGAPAELPTPQLLSFVHPLVGAAVYEQLPTDARLTGHALAARLLSGAGADAERVASHLLLVPPADDPWVADRLNRAAEMALARGSPEAAVGYLERCLAEPPHAGERAELLVRLGTVAHGVHLTTAVRHLEAALALVEGPVERARVAEMLGRCLFMVRRYRRAIDVYARVTADLEETHVDLRARLEAGMLQAMLAEPHARAEAACRLDGLRGLARGDTVGERTLDCLIAFHDAIRGSPVGPVLARARRGLAGDVLIERANGGQGVFRGGKVLIAADDEDAIPLCERALAQAHRSGSLTAFMMAASLRSLASLWRGALSAAESDARDALRVREVTLLTQTRAFHADALMEQGHLDEAEAVLAAAGPVPELPNAGHWYFLVESRGRLLMLQERYEAALQAMLDCGRQFAQLGGQNPAFAAWRSGAALALLALGRSRDAADLAAEELRLARRWGTPRPLGRALRVCGLVTAGAEGIDLLQQAVEVLAPSPARLEHAKALIDLGAALRRAGHRSEARSHLREGIALADVCGAGPLVERGREELRASGARPRRRALKGPAALTPSELRVARLAADGHTNRTIAQTLFVTPRTVEVHLTSVYRKLAVSRRGEVREALRGQA